MPDFKMSEMEPKESGPLRGFDTEETSPLRNDGEDKKTKTFATSAELDADPPPPRRGSWLGSIILFILIAALAVAGYYGYNELKQIQEQSNVYGSGELAKIEKKFEALLAENNLKLSQEIQAMGQKQAELANQLAATLKKAEGTASDLGKSNKNLANLLQMHNDLTDKYNTTVKNLAEAQKKLTALESLSKDLANAEARIKDLESTVVTAANALDAINKTTANLSGQIETLAKQQTELSKNLADVIKKQAAGGSDTATTAQLKQLQSELDKTNLEILKIKNLADASVTKELTAIKNELGDLKRKVDLLK